MKEMMDDPRTGLRDSSDTNKTRYGLLALLEEARKEGFSEGQKYALGLDEEIVRQD